MKKALCIRALGFLVLIGGVGCKQQSDTRIQRKNQRVLQISQDEGGAIPSSVVQGETIQWTQADLSWIVEDSLMKFSAVILDKVDAETLSLTQQTDLERYVQAGNGLVWINPVLIQKYTWPWLDTLFSRAENPTAGEDHQLATKIRDEGKPEMIRAERKLEYDGGRVVLLPAKASTDALPPVLEYAIGNNSYDPARMHSRAVPRSDRFTKVVLDDHDINEPMQLDVLPDGRVIFLERRGKIKMYMPRENRTKLLATFDVCTDGNYEDGLHGIAHDPDFEENGYLYIYYSKGADCSIPSQYLSRFKMHFDSLIVGSEKLIMEVPVQRETCCHSGGGLIFDAKGNLWLSTGDNTSSKESDGYSPLDDRPGRGPFDAQKSSANSNDLRGKILKIRPTVYGGYDIPEGNLFPKDGSQGRPEIYVMGARNPFRISVDDRTGFVYWGDVGPDVGVDGKYGPQSFDEWNQAREPGYFGWPYFVGDNYAYRSRDFDTDEVGAYFDPAHPMNTSPNNTGITELPVAQPAYIWYPKDISPEFPMLGAGSNSAMAGPVFYPRPAYTQSKKAFPDYYTGKLFIYEWARSWIMAVSMNEAGDLTRIEPFLPELEWVKPIDMAFGPDGAMYVLEYGQNYFMNNPKARLSRIEYAAGNRLPVPSVEVTREAGAAPLTTTFSAAGSYDYDRTDSVLRYLWYFSDSSTVSAEGAQADFTFKEPGTYYPALAVVDGAGDTAWTRVDIRVGNEPPRLTVEFAGNKHFYFEGQRPAYNIQVEDPEDLAASGIDASRLDIQWVYVPDGEDLQVMLGQKAALPRGMQYARGMRLIESSDCKSCHDMRIHSVGPSYLEVAERYAGDYSAPEYLAGKIIQGGNGVWGEKIMAGHPQHTLEETREMARYILSLSNQSQSLPRQGNLEVYADGSPQGAYLLAATYTDQGGNGQAPETRRETLVLRAPVLQAEKADTVRGAGKGMAGANRDIPVLRGLGAQSKVAWNSIDLSGIAAVRIRYMATGAGDIILRAGEASGPVWANARLNPGGENNWQLIEVPVRALEGLQPLTATFKGGGGESFITWDWMEFIPARS